MNFAEILQRGVAACYQDETPRTAYVFPLDGGTYELRVDVPAGLYTGTHDLNVIMIQLRNLGIPLDHGWEVFKRRNVSME